MKRFRILCASLVLTLQAVSFLPATAATKSKELGTAPTSVISEKLDALATYVALGDTASLVGLWAEDGTYVDDAGKEYRGKAELQKRFSSAFNDGGRPKLGLKPIRTQVLGPAVILSEGFVSRQGPAGKITEETRYVFVFTKKGGDWLISSASETPIIHSAENSAAPGMSLADLSWMVGDWKAQRDGRSLTLHVDWVGNKNFLRWNYQISKPGEQPQDNTEVVAFDPKTSSLVSYYFDSTGTFGQGSWSGDASQWQIECVKTAPDGSTQTARQIITPKGQDGFTWQSVDRSGGGMPMPDTAELQIERQTK